MRRRCRAIALGTLGASSALWGHADEPPPPVPLAAYEDRILESGPQAAPDASEDQSPESGWPRSGRVEVQSLRQSGLTQSRNEILSLGGHLDTADYGAFSVDLNLHRYRDAMRPSYAQGETAGIYSPVYRSGSTGRIDQRAMPFNGGWLADNSIGDINTASTPLSRGIGRIFLPAAPIAGFTTSAAQGTRTMFNASAGRLGYFDGFDSKGFTHARGSVVTFGAQQQLSGDARVSVGERTDAAFQYIETRNANLNGSLPSQAQDTRSFWGAGSWQGVAPWARSLGPGIGAIQERPGGLRVQANVARSAGRPSAPGSGGSRDTANGVWVDGSWRSDWAQQDLNVFYFDPSLRWGSNPIVGDLKGMAWRADVATRQWQLAGQAELSESVSGLQGKSLFGSLFGRYRFDSRDAVSATMAARTGNTAAQSLQFAWEHVSPAWGQTQWRADFATGNRQQTARIGVDQTWSVGEAHSLSTSLAVERSDLFGVPSRSVLWGVLGTMPFLTGARVDLSVRGSNGGGTGFLNANARLSWPLRGGWSLIAQYTAARSQEPAHSFVVSALTTAAQTPVFAQPSSRSVQLSVRWDGSAGVASAPIGGAPGAGSGRIEGRVFFDQNYSGTRDANEGGVPNITVVLNGRFVTRTNEMGIYSFAPVAAGDYEVEMVPDNIPLPWAAVARGRVPVQVYVRSTAIVDFATQRDR